jgi:hypothetical protein
MLQSWRGVGFVLRSKCLEGNGPLSEATLLLPMIPIFLPAAGSRLQSSRVKGVICKTEIMRVAIAEVGWQTVHEF